MNEKENLLDVFNKLKIAVKKRDVVTMKELSNRTVHSASVIQDTDSISIAVIVYALSKIIERDSHKNYGKNEKFYKLVLNSIENSIKSLKKEDYLTFQKNLEEISVSVNSLSINLRKYVKDVFRKARINKASKIYEHGISMEQTAKLLGVSMWELATYFGQKNIDDENIVNTYDVKSRIKIAMDMFK